MLRSLQIQTSVCVGGLILALSMFQSAEAQRRDLGGMRPGNVSPPRLLTVDVVQAELNLTEAQKSKAAVINETLTFGRHELFAQVAKGTGKRAPRMAELEHQAQDSIEELLDDAQEKRLKELLLQVNGASELTKPEVRDALGITKEQRKKLADIRQVNAKARHEALANFDGDRLAKSLELQREADAKLLDVLTDEQRQQFDAMQGEKITLDVFST
ncbi:MAG: hypothetical protein WD738_22305 [Pirellulales bacterium]